MELVGELKIPLKQVVSVKSCAKAPESSKPWKGPVDLRITANFYTASNLYWGGGLGEIERM